MNIPRFLPIAVLLLWPPYPCAFAQEEIRFAKGAVTGTVRGEVTSATKTYLLRAQKGQHISAVLEPAGGDKGILTMTLYAYCGEEYGRPLASESLRWEVQVPCSGRYTIDVAPSSDAIKRAGVQRYALTLTMR